MTRSAPASAALALALVGSGCDGQTEPRRTAPTHTPADVEGRADEVYGAFAAMFDNLPDPTATSQTCPDDKIVAWTPGEAKRKITFLAYQSLRHTLDKPWEGNNSLVRFMTNSKVRYAPRATFDLTVERNIKQLMRMWTFVEYVGLVVPISERRAQASSAYTGDGGAFKGQLVIYRPGTPEPICHTPFSVTGSGKASYRHTVGDNANARQGKAQYALKQALCSDISAEIRTQLGRISGELQPSYIDCNSV